MFTALYTLPPLFIAVILHEIAHGYVADKLGDPTARDAGRITLNPLVHIDPFMTIILPLLLFLFHSPILFGGAKPVPVNALNFKNPRRGMLWVALAGPLTNFTLAAIAFIFCLLLGQINHSVFFKILPDSFIELLANWLVISVVINVVLGLFNLFPVPPLDGGRIAVGLLPLNLARSLAKLEPYGIIIVVIALSAGLVNVIISPVLQFVFTQAANAIQ